jgi:phosphoglucosamine mutase
MDLTLNGLRVVLDCANGAGYKVGPTVLWELGAEVFTLGCEPNGRNINDGCGSLYPEKLAQRVREVRADLGIALDGDADRVLLVNGKGEEVDGDMILALCARDMKERKCLKGQGVVSTVMSNMGLEKSLESEGLHLVRTQVGDRYVVEAMRRDGYNLGGEQSGHMIFLDHSRTGDGLMSALQVLAIMARRERSLSELTADFQRFPQALHSIRVAEKKPLESLPTMQAAIRKVETELAGRGRVLIRYSGTEPVVRIMVEAEDEKRVREYAHHLVQELKRAVGAEEE